MESKEDFVKQEDGKWKCPCVYYFDVTNKRKKRNFVVKKSNTNVKKSNK